VTLQCRTCTCVCDVPKKENNLRRALRAALPLLTNPLLLLNCCPNTIEYYCYYYCYCYCHYWLLLCLSLLLTARKSFAQEVRVASCRLCLLMCTTAAVQLLLLTQSSLCELCYCSMYSVPAATLHCKSAVCVCMRVLVPNLLLCCTAVLLCCALCAVENCAAVCDVH
jgi:hypothetical protein